MDQTLPLVSAMIATRNRPEELRRTLQELKVLDYPNLEVIVIDDFSDVPVEPVVRSVFFEARVVRHEFNTGQCQRRSEGFRLAKGKYILHLDDDCCLTVPGDLHRAVAVMEQRPAAGVLAVYLYNGPELPSRLPNGSLHSGYVATFIGAAALIRTESVQATVGYRSFFGNDWEEDELCMQLLSGGHGVWFDPSLVAHHRLSSLNRASERTWMRGLRNRCWSIVLHMPWQRIPMELGWKLTMGGWDAVRLGRPRLYLRAIGEFSSGLGRVWALRHPFDGLALRRYDAIRSHPCLPEADFAQPPSRSWREIAAWWHRWRNRARDRNLWDTGEGGTGTSYTAGYAHEYKDKE